MKSTTHHTRLKQHTVAIQRIFRLTYTAAIYARAGNLRVLLPFPYERAHIRMRGSTTIVTKKPGSTYTDRANRSQTQSSNKDRKHIRVINWEINRPQTRNRHLTTSYDSINIRSDNRSIMCCLLEHSQATADDIQKKKNSLLIIFRT